MELKVWVEGIQRIVCGVTVNTTCQDVVFALAHATGKVGRFTLIERWRNNERLLAPNENPLKLLLKWGEYANDVQFILQRSENKQQPPPAQGQQQAADTDAAKVQQQQQRTDTSSSCSSSSSPQILNSASNTVMITKKPLGISNNNNNTSSNILNNNHNNNSNANCIEKSSRELKKSFGAYDVKHNENIGIVKGIPQRITQQQQHNKKASPNSQQHVAQQQKQQQSSNTSSPTLVAPLQPKHEKSHSNPIEMGSSAKQQQQQQYQQHQQQPHNYNESGNNNNNIYQQLGAHNSKSINEINLAIVRESLGRRTTGGPARPDSPDVLMYNSGGNNTNPSTSSTASNENLLDIYNGNARVYGSPHGADPVSASPTDIYKNTPAISANGALVPPPYRDPPPPRNSPMQLQQQQHQQQSARLYGNGSNAMTAGQANTNPFLHDYEHTYDTYEYHNAMNNNNNNNNNMNNNNNNMNAMNTNTEESESIFQATQYNDLLQLIKFQREKISAQQMEMNEYDAEIVFLEGKERDQAQELEAISREITKVDQIYHQGSEQLQSLQYVEEENELVKQQEKTLKSEIALLRSKLSNCEMELLQCKNKIRLLMDDIEVEQRSISNKQKTNRQNVERDFLMEMERIQIEIDQAMHNADSSNKTSENLEKEIMLIENAIAEKKRQVEQLVNEMKEVNLQSLTVTTSEEIKHLLEGPTKPGSSRRIIGSPRQLENAVPTSKNPHGVWV